MLFFSILAHSPVFTLICITLIESEERWKRWHCGKVTLDGTQVSLNEQTSWAGAATRVLDQQQHTHTHTCTCIHSPFCFRFCWPKITLAVAVRKCSTVRVDCQLRPYCLWPFLALPEENWKHEKAGNNLHSTCFASFSFGECCASLWWPFRTSQHFRSATFACIMQTILDFNNKPEKAISICNYFAEEFQSGNNSMSYTFESLSLSIQLCMFEIDCGSP